MDLATTLDKDAEAQAYLSTVSERIGKLIAERVDYAQFLDGGADYLRELAATVLLVILAELADDAEAAGRELAQAAGLPDPSPAQIEQAMANAITDTLETVVHDLTEAQAGALKGPQTAEALGLPPDMGTSSASFTAGIAGVLAGIFGAAGKLLTGEIAGGINLQTALGEDGTDTPNATGRRLKTLKWVTRHDKRVCSEESPAGTSASGVDLPENFQSSCEGRHGVVLPAEDWISEGFPRDARLLCSRFGRPRCRCVLVHWDASIPPSSLDTSDATARGKQAGEEEPLDVTDTHLEGAADRVRLRLHIDASGNLIRIRTRRTGGVRP